MTTRSKTVWLLFFAVFFMMSVFCQRGAKLDKWTYIQVDDDRTRYDGRAGGDGFWFGLAMGDVTGDGFLDIASGKWFYRNPGGDMEKVWVRSTFPDSIDALLIVDVDGDEYGDVIGAKCNKQYWYEAKDREGIAWTEYLIGTLPVCNHGTTTQGYAVAQMVAGGKPEILLHGIGVYCLQIPDSPEAGNWPYFTILEAGGNGEWLGTGDMDGDGDLDICLGLRPESRETQSNKIAWLENPGDGSGDWAVHEIGISQWHVDKALPADFNGDGRMDVVVSEEIWPGLNPEANMYLFEAPVDPKSPDWKRTTIVTQYSMNNLDVADMDDDGDLDIITCEHKGPHEKLQIWVNDGKGRFKEKLIDMGKESHLGARVADMDNDGDIDIVSIAWNDFQYVHLWRNDAIAGDKPLPRTTAPLGLAPKGDYQYKVSLDVLTGEFERFDKPASATLNFTQLFQILNQTVPFDFSSIRVVEVAPNGATLDDQVVFQFDRADDYDAAANAVGTLTFIMKGKTPAKSKRTFQVLFGPQGGYYVAPVFLKQVVFDDFIQHEGFRSYKLVTPTATYLYHKKGSGFASMIDREGKDWISYHPEGGAKGSYRGIPNIAPSDFHPGPGELNKESRIIAQGPVKVSFLSETLDEKWGCFWDVYPGYATMTLFKKGEEPYWILYEGTPGGEFTIQDYYVTSDGNKVDIAPLTIENKWNGDLPNPEWVYFGDVVQNRVLYFIHHEYSPAIDEFWHFGDGGMTVFGFGRGPREEGWQRLTEVPTQLTIGFAESREHGQVTRQINSAYQPMQVVVGEPSMVQ